MNRIRDWISFHRTAKYRLARQAKTIAWFADENAKLEKIIDDMIDDMLGNADMFVMVDHPGYNGVAPTVPNDPTYLGEFPPVYSESVDGSLDDLYKHEGPGL